MCVTDLDLSEHEHQHQHEREQLPDAAPLAGRHQGVAWGRADRRDQNPAEDRPR